MEYQRINNFVICPMPDEAELDMNEINKIVSHTHNTWQHDRPVSEIRENTIQGKRAEIVIKKLLAENSASRFMAYDKLRKDDFLKHAPFDGIVYRQDVEENILEDILNRINDDVCNSPGDSGTINVKTREYMEEHGIYTIEIKSSLLQDPRDYRSMSHKQKGQRTQKDYEVLCQYIERFYDYFVYPHFCRDNLKISTFYDYTKYVRDNYENFSRNKQEFLHELMTIEFDNACHIYTRVFFDLFTDEIIIPGYVIKARFYEEPRIQKMPSPKSKNAIYYMYHMKYGSSILDIDRDAELLRWNRLSSYARLLGAYKPACPKCGGELRIVETTSNSNQRQHKFLYVCDSCTGNAKWSEMNRIHPRNMDAR